MDRIRLGYRFDLVYGPLADSFKFLYEFPVEGRTQDSIQKNILNAYVSYTAPIGRGLTFDVGKFTTFIGAEVLTRSTIGTISRVSCFPMRSRSTIQVCA